MNRRELLWGAGLLALTACTKMDQTARPSEPATSATAAATAVATTPSCARPVLSLEQQAAQCLMIGIPADQPLTPAVRARIAAGIGGVCYIPATNASATSIRVLSDEIHQLSPLGALITTDQEGGLVQRLIGPGFDIIASAAIQARMGAEALQQAATVWGRQLHDAGVDIDLAPVADVVPRAFLQSNEPVALLGRGYGTDPAQVTALTHAVIAGFQTGGVGATLKHFPGLGAVVGNTDFAEVTDSVTSLDDPGLAPFYAALRDVEMVMTSSARYQRIDPANPAAFCPTVHQTLRDKGFNGVIISDDVGAAQAMAAFTPGQRAVKFLAAGGDLVLTVDSTVGDAMIRAIVAAATADSDFAQHLARHAQRVLELKAARGLIPCS